MPTPDPTPLSADAFLAWVVDQDERFELVGGAVIRMMTGAKQSHNVATNNIAVALTPGAKTSGCRTTSSDTAVRTGPDGVRFPDIVVDCGPPDPNAVEATGPMFIFEVSSPSTTVADQTDKLEEYRSLDGLRLIALVEADIVLVKVYRRDETGAWQVERYDDLDQVIDLPEIGTVLRLQDIYDTLEPRHRPRLQVVPMPRS